MNQIFDGTMMSLPQEPNPGCARGAACMRAIIDKVHQQIKLQNELVATLELWVQVEEQGIPHADVSGFLPAVYDKMTRDQRKWFADRGMSRHERHHIEREWYGFVKMQNGNIYPLAVPIRRHNGRRLMSRKKERWIARCLNKTRDCRSLYECLGTAKALVMSESRANVATVYDGENQLVVAVVTDDANGPTVHKLKTWPADIADAEWENIKATCFTD